MLATPFLARTTTETDIRRWRAGGWLLDIDILELFWWRRESLLRRRGGGACLRLQSLRYLPLSSSIARP